VRWYLGVRCKKCGVPILFALDRSEGMEGGMPPAAGKLVLTCTLDNCRHQADYTAAAVSRFQKQQANPNQTGRDNESAKNRKHKR
jgi:hypothetical protein